MPMISKKLYVAQSLEKLQEKANLDKKMIVKHTTNKLCNSAKTLLSEANGKLKENDEEMAFVYFFKFLDLVLYLKQKDDFHMNSSSKFLSESAEGAMTAATKLKNSLSKRYATLNASNEKKDSNQNVTLIMNTKTDNKASSTMAIDQEKSTDSVIDTTPDHSIAASKLYSIMNDAENSFLILDIRSKEEFDESHIKHSSCINVPQEILTPGLTSLQLVQNLPPSTAMRWGDKNNVDYVIIMDWDTKDTCLPTSHPIRTLEDAMIKWDRKTPLTKAPLILIGGYKEWLFRYPMITTKALDVLSLEMPRIMDAIANVSSVEYPDLDAALKEEVGSETVQSNKARFSGTPTPIKGKMANGWVNELMPPDHVTKPQPSVNRLVKPHIPSSPNAAFVASQSLDISEKNLKREAEGSPKNRVPEFNRSLKPSWAAKSSNIAEALKQEATAAKESLDNAQEQLKKEQEFAALRLRKELEAEESKRIELQKQEEVLLDNIRMLQKQNEEHEQQYLALKEENLEMKKLLESHSTEEQKVKEKEIEKIEVTKEDLMKEVDRLRQDRKRKEQKNAEVRPNTSPSLTTLQENEKNLLRSSSKEQGNYRPENEYTIRLKDTSDNCPSRGLTRSYSSPNIAQMVADQTFQSKKTIPTVDRSLKPKFEYRPSFDENSTYKMRNLNPTYGSVPGRPATGLRNLGNTCYMNSIIQCLSNTKQLADYFTLDMYKDHVRRNSKHGTNGDIVFEFALIIKSLWAGQYKSFSPKDFKNIASKYIPMCVGSEQQDSHEFLVVLMDKLHADLNQGHSTDSLPNLDSYDVSIATEKFWNHHRMGNRSKISETFEGLIRSTLTCLSCRKTSNSYEVFSCLSLPISSFQCTLKDSLDTFLKPEKMSGEGAWECPRCRLKKDAEKILVFSKLPDVLVIQLKRFSYEGMWRRKIQAVVKFPFSLDLSAESSCTRKYSLYGIVNHFGYLEGGHYTAYCKNPNSYKWFKYDDHEVSEISSSEIVTSAAYLLFYYSQDSRM